MDLILGFYSNDKKGKLKKIKCALLPGRKGLVRNVQYR
jgi:hypothetical protein